MAAALLIPALGLSVALDRLDRLSEHAALDSVSPITTSPTRVEIDEATSVNVTPVYGPTVDVVAPRWEGLITWIGAKSGQNLESGTAVLEVDGVIRRAFATARPFYRPLSIGDEGDDVADLHLLLAQAGLIPAERSAERGLSSSTLRAIREFAASIGVTSSVSGFDPTWVLWQPKSPFVVENVPVGVGAAAPAAGEPVLIGRPTIDGIRIEGDQGAIVDTSGTRILTVGDLEIRLEDGAANAEGLVRLSERAVFAARTAPEGSETDPTVIAQLSLVSPVAAFAIPASAVQASLDDDDLCVWVGDGGQDTFKAQSVAVHPGGASTVFVTGGLTERSEVLTNPADFLRRPACP